MKDLLTQRLGLGLELLGEVDMPPHQPEAEAATSANPSKLVRLSANEREQPVVTVKFGQFVEWTHDVGRYQRNSVNDVDATPAVLALRDPSRADSRSAAAGGDPLFLNQSRRWISKRWVQFAWRRWQKGAGFDRLYPFQCTRHTAVTSVYRMSKDLFLAQRFARHVSPLTTVVYTHPSDQEMAREIRGLPC